MPSTSDAIRFIGYAFQIEMKYRVKSAGFRIVEVPITFIDRQEGSQQDELRHLRRGVHRRAQDAVHANSPAQGHGGRWMNAWLIRNARVVNEGRAFQADVLVRDGVIERVAEEGIGAAAGMKEFDAQGNLLLPGVIDDQVHFREPGLTHKDDIAHGSAAAVAGGITSFFEMPNTDPPALSQDLLADKYTRASATSVANHSFYMGVGNTNMDEVLRTDPRTVCGLKAFLGSSTGDLLVDDERYA